LTENNFDIKLKEHYKLYVLLKDKIIFESELKKKGIKYYTEINEQPYIERGIRYFLLDSDMEKIDIIIRENGIVANTETNLILDYRDEKKVSKLYIAVTGVIIIIIILISLILNIFN
jgi:2-C-methyl-D-erythritol 4-phosphate cytidylyltransferase